MILKILIVLIAWPVFLIGGCIAIILLAVQCVYSLFVPEGALK